MGRAVFDTLGLFLRPFARSRSTSLYAPDFRWRWSTGPAAAFLC